MKRRLALLGAIALVLISQAVAATADEHDALPEHPHVLVLDAQVDFSGEEPVLLDARKCVDLAGNLPLSLRAHHTNVHFGPAGQALLTEAGHVVAPTAPFPGVPWTDCESFLAFFGVD
ncbi:hypothetical protein [Salsipaludibacter albus]|uniref:hypothetical protein n=1 Tax=Salsipaludibacter albus TaxID=2849650 RepID=UPI001EE4A04C|nr:hypothetical protein [Salsipaludibacter albus]MBY5163724.1 hypothetical protein [Salsipaludibacter albus]